MAFKESRIYRLDFKKDQLSNTFDGNKTKGFRELEESYQNFFGIRSVLYTR